MSIEFQAVAFPILACLSLGAILLPTKRPAGATARLIIGIVDVVYAVVLLVTSFTASASS